MKRISLGVIGVKNNIFNLDPLVVGSKTPVKDLTMNKVLMLRKILADGKFIDQVVTGNAPLTLSDAAAKSIVSLTRYGLCTQAAIPTPDAPVDIMCNNGTIKARRHSGLPLGYQKLDNVIGRVGQTVVDTGVRGDLADLRIVFKGQKTSHTSYSPFFGNYIDENTNVTRVIEGANVSSPILFTCNRKAGGGSAGATGIFSDDAHTYDLSSSGLLVDNDEFFQIRDVSGTSNSTKIAICGSAVPSSAASSGASTVFAYFRIYQGETLIRDYVPVKRLSDNKVGFYELVNDTFEPGMFASSYAFTAGSPVDDPVELYADGTPEVLTVSADGAATQTASVPTLLSVGDYADEAELISGIKTGKVGVKVLDGTETGWALSDSGTTHRFRGTKPSDCYTPANRAPSVCTHFKYVSTGAEVGGMFIGASQYWYFIPTDQTIDTADEWTDWLAAQYAAGTPVIIIYPLAEETTEQVTAQHLVTNEGTNIVDSVANVSPVGLEIVYKKKK